MEVVPGRLMTLYAESGLGDPQIAFDVPGRGRSLKGSGGEAPMKPSCDKNPKTAGGGGRQNRDRAQTWAAAADRDVVCGAGVTRAARSPGDANTKDAASMHQARPGSNLR